MKIIVDLLGSDKGVETIFKGVIETSKLLKDLYFVVIGPRETIEKVNISDDLKNRLQRIYFKHGRTNFCSKKKKKCFNSFRNEVFG